MIWTCKESTPLSNPALRDVINAAPTRTQNGISYTIKTRDKIEDVIQWQSGLNLFQHYLTVLRL